MDKEEKKIFKEHQEKLKEAAEKDMKNPALKEEDLNAILKLLKWFIEEFDDDSFSKDMADEAKTTAARKRSKCALMLADIAEEYFKPGYFRKDDLRKELCKQNNIHDHCFDNVVVYITSR